MYKLTKKEIQLKEYLMQVIIATNATDTQIKNVFKTIERGLK